jgi:glycosyltransferase involved in cell wall biosynthesis
MNILLVHQNYPAQFKHLAPALARAGHQVVVLTMREQPANSDQQVKVVTYRPGRGTTTGVHPWVGDFETKVIRGEACLQAAIILKEKGFEPQVIVAHHGWGESLFLKELWPYASLGIYCEFYYRADGLDVGFDKEFSKLDLVGRSRLRLRNLSNMVHFEVATRGISPTLWQASTFPSQFRNKIDVIHDGIDTDAMVPNPNISINLINGLRLQKGSEVITFVNRSLEPYRGYHSFMRALPQMLKAKPNAQVLIVGDNGVSYGEKPPQGTWKDIFWNEAKQKMNDQMASRVHFLGRVPYDQFLAILQISTVHVYLTYPFVLSWSLLEAMSVGCAIVASNTQPLHEAIEHKKTGLLVDFFDYEQLAKDVVMLLDSAELREALGRNARNFAKEHYDLKRVCLPKQLAWVESLSELV